MIPPRSTTVQGFELQFGVNHVGHFLLTNLLLERGLISNNGRIVNLSSGMARLNGKIRWNDLQSTNASMWQAYGQSKLANVLFTIELEARLRKGDTNITAYSVDPGAVKTDLQRNSSVLLNWMRVFFKTPLQGASTSLYCALQPGIEHQAGGFFVDSKLMKSPGAKFNATDASQLWDVTEALLKRKFPVSE